VTAISATLVKELREMTGAGIMDAKRALQDTGGDVDAAKKLLREKGMASADKRAGKATTEGKIGYRIHDDGSRGTIVGVGCETEPVSNKLGVLVQLRGASPELARKVAMHIAASAPQYIAREDVPDELVSAERDIYLASDEVQSKPEQAREKIVEGMVNKRFFAAQVLAEQPWIHDPAKTVGLALEEEGAQVAEFERISLSG